MTFQEDILAELTAEQITKIIGEVGQGDINILEAVLAEQAAKIKFTEDMVDKEHKHGFLVLMLRKTQYGKVIGNETVQWTAPEDPGGCDGTIQAKDMTFDRRKNEKSMQVN